MYKKWRTFGHRVDMIETVYQVIYGYRGNSAMDKLCKNIYPAEIEKQADLAYILHVVYT